MDEGEYLRQADAALQRIEAALEAVEGDIDFERTAGGMLQIECADGSKIVVNQQAAVQEIWVAARTGGFHYRWDGGSWRDTRSGEELHTALARLLAEQCGARLPPP